ncbi:unnamed protein product [Larinioides sclopetarius]|uniref:Neurotransmitter-gated ion-channel ligand-binding domain-containing protein n=1 Tax=Larinioides sclopetarius TaxID=280406 RepID=A0AAV2A0C9_9ARAC
MAAFSFSLVMCLVAGTVFSNVLYTENESDLRKTLFENYDKLVRPVRDMDDVVVATVGLSPLRIRDVDVKDKTVKLDTWLVLRWQDASLRWVPSENAGLEELSIAANDVWRPDIALYTASPDTNLFPSVMVNVVIFHNGTVLWIPPYSFKSMCSPQDDEVTTDTFRCTLEMGSWTYDIRRVTVHEREQDVMQGMGRETFKDTNEKWTLESMTARSEERMYSRYPERYSLVKFDLLFRKKARSGE